MKKRLDQIFLVIAGLFFWAAAMMIGSYILSKLFVIAGFIMGFGGIIWWLRDWIQTLDLPFENAEEHSNNAGNADKDSKSEEG